MGKKYNFKKELDLIKDIKIREFTANCLTIAPDYFWTEDASSSGKYHAGRTIIRHTREGFRVANDLCFNFEIVGIERDCVLSAFLNHDIVKRGLINSGHTVDGHGALFIEIVNQLYSRDEILNTVFIKCIIRLVTHHMGRWDVPYEVASDKIQMVIQVADYISSRDYILVKLDGE